MKAFVFLVLAIAAFDFSWAEDDGQYRPATYGGDDGKYRKPLGVVNPFVRYYNNYDGLDRYGSYFNGLVPGSAEVNPIFRTIDPLYVNRHTRFPQLYSPLVDINSIDNQAFASQPVVSVTYRPPVNFPVVPKVKSAVYSRNFQPLPQVVASTRSSGFYKSADQNAKIVRQDNDISGNNYHYLYETDNGINVEEAGNVDGNGKGAGTNARGFYEYVGDNGVKYRVDYTADENGFRPVGAHLPQNV